MLRLLTLAILLIGLSIKAAPASTIDFDFSGYCVDCGQPAAGLLTLADEQPGVALTLANVVSFTYFGSNLLAPFTETNPTFVLGTFSSDPTQMIQLQIAFGTYTLVTQSDGDWVISLSGPVQGNPGNGGGIDNGINGLWTAVPEPASALLLLAPLALCTLTRRIKPPG